MQNISKILKAGFVLFFALLIPSIAAAAQLDRDFIYMKMNQSGCPVTADSFANEFAKSIDRLAELNPKLVQHIRTVSYSNDFSIKCILPSSSDMIYWDPDTRSILLRENTPDTWRTASNVFHEFLHFVGVKIDFEYHHNINFDDVFEKDFVYACHFAVFPQLAEIEALKELAGSLPIARASCAKAVVEINP